MARNPIHVEHIGLRTPRDRMWSAMKTLFEFTPSEVEDKAHPINSAAVRDYLECLVNSGHVRLIKAQTHDARAKFTNARYQVVKMAAFTPQLNAKGETIKPNIGVLAMWRSMKVRKVFTAHTVATDSSQGSVSCTLGTAKTYCKALHRTGFLTVAKPASNAGGLSTYRLVRDTGPLPPAITRVKAVYDRNTGELHLGQTAQEVCDAVG